MDVGRPGSLPAGAGFTRVWAPEPGENPDKTFERVSGLGLTSPEKLSVWVRRHLVWVSHHMTFGLGPRHDFRSGSTEWARVEAARRSVVFKAAYVAARDAWIGGDREAVFPFGTWLMLRRFAVRCAASPPV